MATTLLDYTARFAGPGPEMIERDKATRLRCEVWYEEARVKPTAGTVLVRDSAGATVVTAAITGNDASGNAYYDLLAASVPATLSPSSRWMVEWTLTFADLQVHTFRRDAHLVLRRLYPAINAADLTRRHHELASLVPRMKTSLQDYISDAWEELLARLVEDGRYPQRIMSPGALAEVHKALALHRAYFDCQNDVNGEDVYGRKAAYWMEQYEQKWSRMRFNYDHDDDNLPPSEDEEGESQMPVVYLGGAPRSRTSAARATR